MASREDPGRTAYNWLFRVLGDRRAAKRLAARVPPGALERGPADTLEAIGPLLRETLDPSGLARTIYGRGAAALRELPPAAPRVTADDRPSTDPTDPMESWPPEQRGLVELCLVDRVPPDRIAAALGISQDLLMSFLAQVIDDLGDLGTIPLGDGAPHLTTLVSRALADHLASARPAALVADRVKDPAGVAPDPVARVTHRCHLVLELLSRDGRIVSMSSSALIRRALEGPKVEIAPRDDWVDTALRRPQDREKDPRDRAVAGETDIPWGPWRMRALVVGVLLGVIATVSGPREPEPVSPAIALRGAYRIAEPATVVGSWSVPGRPREDLRAGVAVQAPPGASLAAHLTVGLSIIAGPGSRLVPDTGRLELVRGTFRLATDWPLARPLEVTARTLRFEIARATATLSLEPAGTIRLTVVDGTLPVSEPEPRDLRIGETWVVGAAVGPPSSSFSSSSASPSPGP